MPIVLVGLYATEVSITLLIVLLMIFFAWSRPLPSDFSKDNFGRIAGCLGCILKTTPRLVILFHYIIAIVLLVMMGQVGRGDCAESVSASDYTSAISAKKDTNLLTRTPMQKEATVLIIVLSIVWTVMFMGGWVTRGLIYIEPYLVDPYDQ